LTPDSGSESLGAGAASLFEEPSLSPHEKKLYDWQRADTVTHLDETAEKLEAELSSPEIVGRPGSNRPERRSGWGRRIL